MKRIGAFVGICLLGLSLGASMAAAQTDTGSITGRVTDEATGAPRQNAGINVYTLSGEPAFASGPMSPDGSYVIADLPAGSYKLQWVDSALQGYATEWWEKRSDFESADVVEVAAGEVTAGIDFTVSIPPPPPGGFLEGHLTDLTVGEPVPEGFRLGIDVHEPVEGALVMSDVAWTDAAGRYRFGPVPEGSFKLKFVDSSLFVYGEQWWPDQRSFENADVVEIVLNEVTAVDWALQQQAVVPDVNAPQVSPQLPFTGAPGWWPALLGLALTLVGWLTLSLAPDPERLLQEGCRDQQEAGESHHVGDEGEEDV